MVIDILKSLLVGICAAIPFGPIAIFVLGKCLNKGRRSGMVTAFGSVFVDTVYSIIAIFALAAFKNFMSTEREWVSFGGGVILLVVGIAMAVGNPFRKSEKAAEMEKHPTSSASPADFFQAVLMGFSNLGAVLIIFGLFAFFGLGNSAPRNWSIAPVIIAFSCGETLWWLFFTFIAAHFHGRISIDKMVWLNRFMGLILAILGLAFIADGIFRLVDPGSAIF